ncbi:hypothetical protein [Thiolapillus sp.]
MIHRLLVPGLLEAPPVGVDISALPRFPFLERLLCRAHQIPAPDTLEGSLLRIFQVQEDRAAIAALSWLGQTGETCAGGVIQATPVHFRADRDQVLVFQLDEAQLDMEEARSFCDMFNQHFRDDGLSLKVATPLEWYLFTDMPVQMEFKPLSMVAGRSMADFMPVGDDQRYWRSILNETQMLFFQSEQNECRSSQGRLSVSGLWLSGGGALPEPGGMAPQRTEGNSSLMAGLRQRATGIDSDAELILLRDIEKSLLAQDAQAWLQGLVNLEQRLMSLTVDEVCLYPCSGMDYHWKPSMQYYFWRRPKGLGALIQTAEEHL